MSIGIYLVTYLIYVFVINGKRKSFEKLKKNSEVMYIINRYKLDMRKVKYKRLLNTLAVINSFIIACGACIIMNVKSLILSTRRLSIPFSCSSSAISALISAFMTGAM